MPKRIPPSPDAVGKLVADYMSKTSDDPMRFVPDEYVVRWVRHGFRTTMTNAREWLDEAVYTGTLIRVRASHKGKHLSQWKRNTMPDRMARFMLDSIEDAEESFIYGYAMDESGKVFFDSTYPVGRRWAEHESDWVTTPERFRKFIANLNAYISARQAEYTAETTIKKSLIDIKCGDSLNYLFGILNSTESPKSVSFDPYLEEDENIHLNIAIRGEDAINTIGHILKKAGVQPNTTWRGRVNP